VVGQTVICDLFPFRAGSAVVAVGVDGQAAAGEELAPDLDVLGVHELDEVLHYDVDAVLVEVTVIPEGEEVELQGLAFDHALGRDVGDRYRSEVRLARDGAQRRELRAVELDPVVVILMLVLESLQHSGIVVEDVVGLFVAKFCKSFIVCHYQPLIRLYAVSVSYVSMPSIFLILPMTK